MIAKELVFLAGEIISEETAINMFKALEKEEEEAETLIDILNEKYLRPINAIKTEEGYIFGTIIPVKDDVVSITELENQTVESNYTNYLFYFMERGIITEWNPDTYVINLTF